MGFRHKQTHNVYCDAPLDFGLLSVECCADVLLAVFTVHADDVLHFLLTYCSKTLGD